MANPIFPRLYGQTEDGGHSARVQDSVAGVLGPVAKALQNTPIMGAAPPPWIRPDLLNGWINDTTTAQTDGVPLMVAGFHKDALGYVHIKGALSCIAGVAARTDIFMLPPGCRPKEAHTFALPGSRLTTTGVAVVGVGVPGGLAFSVLPAVYILPSGQLRNYSTIPAYVAPFLNPVNGDHYDGIPLGILHLEISFLAEQ